MVYKAIGLMSGSSLDGLDIVFAEFQEHAGKWEYKILQADCFAYSKEWENNLKNATSLSARDYQLLHVEFGHYIGQLVNGFIEDNKLNFQVALIAFHGHTTFHIPSKKMTAQLGCGAALAAVTRLPVVTDLRALDVALGGQGAPIVPIGEKLLMDSYNYFLNIGGIANLSAKNPSPPGEGSWGNEAYIAFDICPANRVLNLLANEAGKKYDEDGEMAASGTINNQLLDKLNELDYYKKPFPKSLANDFGIDIVYPMIRDSGIEIQDALRTYVEHIVLQTKRSIPDSRLRTPDSRLLATGGGALNNFLMKQLQEKLNELKIEIVIPGKELVLFKEALIMALIGVLRWRQEYNVLSSVTGAVRDSIGGALWIGQEA